MYEFSAKLNTKKHRYDRFAWIISAADGARIIRFYPPNLPDSRSILGLQKNGTDAEIGADSRAVIRAENYAEPHAEHGAETFADLRAVACADDCTAKMAPMQKAVQTFVQKICKWKNLKSQRY